jgi:hypothetical protein
MLTENPYKSPTAARQTPTSQPPLVYKSRWQAVRAGLWRGAKFGGKWMAIVCIALVAISFAFIAAIAFDRMRKGIDVRPSWMHLSLELLKALSATILAIAWVTIVGAIAGAAIMGAAAAVTYRRTPKEETERNHE